MRTVEDIRDTVAFAWDVAGTKTVTVTAANRCGVVVSRTHDVAVELADRLFYLPLVLRDSVSFR